MTNFEKQFIKLKSGARIHIQVIDPTGVSGFKLGGIGLALLQPTFEVVVALSEVTPETGFIRDTKYLQEFALENPQINTKTLHVYTKSDIANHVGLGSGTIYRTLIRKGIQKILNLQSTDLKSYSLTGVGQYAVLHGGLVIVSGIPIDNRTPYVSPNLIKSLKIPANWQVILCIPKNKNLLGLSGKEENDFYEKLAPPKAEELQTISFEIMSKLIPAVLNNNFEKFSESMKIITSLGWKKDEKLLFNEYWNLTSSALYDEGASFAATTSSGPTTYTTVDCNKVDINKIKSNLEKKIGDKSIIVCSQIDNEGLSAESL